MCHDLVLNLSELKVEVEEWRLREAQRGEKGECCRDTGNSTQAVERR